MHIDNLEKPRAQRILDFKEVYVVEKIHGTSSNLSFKINELGEEELRFFSGGMSHQLFINIFDQDALLANFRNLGVQAITIYGEAYGGSMQKMSHSYGKEAKFIAFDVKIVDHWLDFDKAHKLVTDDMNLEFVWFTKSSTDIEELIKWRNQECQQAIRNGMGHGHKSEGIVIRPLWECATNNGKRMLVKFKNADFQERKNPPSVEDMLKKEEKLKVLADARKIADEWVTEMRLTHVLDKIVGEIDMTRTGEIIKAMQEDVLREAEGEIIVSKNTLGQIAATTAKMLKRRLNDNLMNKER